MIQSIRNPILILSGEERLPFDPADLRDELMRCFMNAGKEESCYLAGDISLAVEYTLEHADRADRVFSRAELDDMIVRILENTGFADVSRAYRRGSPTRVRTVCAVHQESVAAILKRYFAGSGDHLDELTGQVIRALTLLQAEEAAPELMVELARHFESFTPSEPLQMPVKVRQVDDHYILSLAEVRTVLPGGIPGIGDAARLHGIGRLFPNIQITFSLRQYAVRRNWEAPLLEMTLQPELAEAGRALSAGRDRILQLYREVTGGPENQLPFYLSVPDADDFLEEYLQCTPAGLPALRKTLGDMLAAGITGKIEKLRIGA